MQLSVTLHSTYKWAVHEEVYKVDMPEQLILDHFGATSIDDISTHELGQLVLEGYGEHISTTIVRTESCKSDVIVDVEIL